MRVGPNAINSRSTPSVVEWHADCAAQSNPVILKCTSACSATMSVDTRMVPAATPVDSEVGGPDSQSAHTTEVTVEIRDYRDLDDVERFDKIASIGMVEHVGAKRLGDYFAAAYRVLKPEGLFLNHGIISIAKARPRSLLAPITRRAWQRDKFITRYVFPDGDLVPTATVVA